MENAGGGSLCSEMLAQFLLSRRIPARPCCCCEGHRGSGAGRASRPPARASGTARVRAQLCSTSCSGVSPVSRVGTAPKSPWSRALALPCVWHHCALSPRRCGGRGAGPALPPRRRRLRMARVKDEGWWCPGTCTAQVGASWHLRLVPIQLHPRVPVHPRGGNIRSRAALWEGECHIWSSPRAPGIPSRAARLPRPWRCSQLPSRGSGLSPAWGVRAARLSSQHH